MRKCFAAVLAVLCVFPLLSYSAQTTQARLFCWSVRFQRGFDQGSSLDLSTVDPPTTSPNGELGMLSLSSTYSHWSRFALNNPNGTLRVVGILNLNVPFNVDVDGNGFSDFFEVARSVSSTITAGIFSFESGGGSASATWSRAAGSKNGTCVLTLQTLQTLGRFTNDFEIEEYKGNLAYAPGSNTVSGTVSLSQTGNAGNQFFGPLSFVKSSTNRFNSLQLQAGIWTNALSQTLAFSTNAFYRDSTWPTNYYGYVEFNDGDPNTTGSNYNLWTLSIDDLNDADHDGIPDFSDDPLPPARRPLLTLKLGTTNLLLILSGEIGRSHLIQTNASLASTNWQLAQSVTLATDPQTVSLPIPAGKTFWRALVP
jgi:hypothetical protein